jgi:protein-tyrosine phosphatase
MTRIWERLWIGALADAERLAKANPHHINTVISLCEACADSKRQAVNYMHFFAKDDRPVTIGQFDAVIDAIAENVRRGTVLVHCMEGMCRAPSFAAAYMFCVGFKNLDGALAEIERLRPFISPPGILFDSIRSHLQ